MRVALAVGSQVPVEGMLHWYTQASTWVPNRMTWGILRSTKGGRPKRVLTRRFLTQFAHAPEAIVNVLPEEGKSNGAGFSVCNVNSDE